MSKKLPPRPTIRISCTATPLAPQPVQRWLEQHTTGDWIATRDLRRGKGIVDVTFSEGDDARRFHTCWLTA